MIKAQKIVVVGAGGLGTPAVLELVRGWLGGPLEILVVDDDVVERSNLNRQVLFSEQDLGIEKAGTLARRVREMFPESSARVKGERARLTAETARAILAGASGVLDCSDHIPSKFLLNDLCSAAGIPFCYGGAVELGGLCLSVPGPSQRRGCLRCLFGGNAERDLELETRSCQTAGILGPVAGLIGCVQAQLLLRLLKEPDGQPSRLHRFSARTMRWASNDVFAAANCPNGCGIAADVTVDLRKERCPHTYLYTKLALEKLSPNAVLEARFGSEQSVENVSLSVSEDGHRVLRRSLLQSANGFSLLIEKNPGART